VGELGERFVLDTAKAQQMNERLTSAGSSIEGDPPGPQPGGPLGSSGALERALSEFERSFAAKQRHIAQSLKDTGGEFANLAGETINLDQQQAQEVSSIERK
jgi:hypothetical protein